MSSHPLFLHIHEARTRSPAVARVANHAGC